MTRKLYYESSEIYSFTARVLSCSEEDGHFAVILDATAFFPGGGGQEADKGTLDGLEVIDVKEKDGEIIHITDKPLTVGAVVKGELDSALRFARMQNHTAEHIISGIVHSKYGFENVGFHLGDRDVTLDFSGELDRNALDEIEDLANTVVIKSIPVSARFPSPDELAGMQYRSKLALTENVRIVTIAGYDACACCAPHVKNTGEIGLIKLLDFQRWKGGVRLNMLAGYRALSDYREKYKNISEIAASLSVKQSEAALAVERVMGELAQKKAALAEAKKELVLLKTAAIPPTQGNLCLFENEPDNDFLRLLALGGAAKCNGICAAFYGGEGGYRYVIASEKIDLRPHIKEINSGISGRGGGKSDLIQGSCTAQRKQIEAFIATFGRQA